MTGHNQALWISRARKALNRLGYRFASDGYRWSISAKRTRWDSGHFILERRTAFGAVSDFLPIVRDDELSEMVSGLN